MRRVVLVILVSFMSSCVSIPEEDAGACPDVAPGLRAEECDYERCRNRQPDDITLNEQHLNCQKFQR